jgi:hypothetical protein
MTLVTCDSCRCNIGYTATVVLCMLVEKPANIVQARVCKTCAKQALLLPPRILHYVEPGVFPKAVEELYKYGIPRENKIAERLTDDDEEPFECEGRAHLYVPDPPGDDAA